LIWMPPKTKKEVKETPKEETKVNKDEQIREADAKLRKDSKPNESDFKIILAGVNGDIAERTLASQLIAFHAPKFPKLMKESVDAITKLVDDQDVRIKMEALKHVKEFLEADKNKVATALYHALAEEERPAIQKQAADILASMLKTDEEFRKSFGKALKDQAPAAQAKMVELIKDNFEFTEENVPFLIEVCQTAFKSALVEGLQLARSKHALLSEEQKAELAAPLFTRLRADLKSKNFDEVCSTVLISLLENTKSLDSTFPERLLEVISDEVAPKIGQFLPGEKSEGNLPVLKRILERSSELAGYVKSPALLVNIYNQIFAKLPKSADEGNLDFSIIERTLFAIAKLARRDARTFSELIGKHLVSTGQPGETDGIEESEEKYKNYEQRLIFIRDSAKEFINQIKAQKEAIHQDTSLSNDEKAEKLRKKTKAITSISNAKNCAFVLLGNQPLIKELPETPSWYSRRPKTGKPSKPKTGKGNFRGGRKEQGGPRQKKVGRNDHRRDSRNGNSRGNNSRRPAFNNRGNNRSRDFGRRK